MDFWDDICDSIRDNVVRPIGDSLISGIEATGRGIDKAVNVVVIDGFAGNIDKAVEFVQENPGKAACVVAATVATGGIVVASAGTIAAAAGSAGLLGTASTGTAISTLSGAALESAALAKIGGGALAVGGSGMAGGTTVIGTVGTAAGGVASAKAIS